MIVSLSKLLIETESDAKHLTVTCFKRTSENAFVIPYAAAQLQ